MDYGRLIAQIKKDEGKRLKVYTDHLGYKTVGVGHLIKDSDPEWVKELELGDQITEEQCQEIYAGDLATAVQDAVTIFKDVWDFLPDIAQEVVVNMLFNLGRSRFLKFKKTIEAIHNQDWYTAKREMLDSKWAAQVPRRANRLAAQIDLLARAD